MSQQKSEANASGIIFIARTHYCDPYDKNLGEKGPSSYFEGPVRYSIHEEMSQYSNTSLLRLWGCGIEILNPLT